jgi:drug/metabolite transporter (DMT)-like permease
MRRLLLLAFIWGWSFLFIKVAVEGLTPPTVAWARITLGAIVLHVVLRQRGVSLPRDRTTWRHFAVTALIGSAIPFTMLAWGEERITSALTAVLNASTPLFTALAAAVLLKDRIRLAQAGGLLLGLAGVAVAAGFGGSDLAGSSLAGSLAAVGAGACYGLAFVYMRRHLVGAATSPIVAAAGQLTAGSVLLLPLAAASSAAGGIELTPKRVLCVVLLGAVGTGVAYVLNYGVIAELGATKASLVTYVIPVVAVAVGVIVLDEPFELRLLAGGALIVAGIALVHDRLRFKRVPAVVGPVAVLLVVAATLVGCGGGSSASTGCGPIVREALDPQNLVHVLPGGADPTYISDPPTSGAHQPGPKITGVVTNPISRPLQVGLLESGAVLIQHRADLDAADRAALEALAGDRVVVAPSADLGKASVVATAWTFKRTCSEVDAPALEQFITARLGKGPNRTS